MNAPAAIGYVRVSTEEQARDGISLDQQEQAVRAYAWMRGLDLAEVVADEGVSAGKPLSARPGGEPSSPPSAGRTPGPSSPTSSTGCSATAPTA